MKDLEQLIIDRGRESAAGQERYCRESYAKILQAANALVQTIRGGGKILIMGNGGSAADAQHFAAELVNRFLMERKPLPALALTTDSSVLTSISNDYSFDRTFSKQVEALGRDGDALVALSTSGASPNVIRALERANAQSLLTVGFTGGDGGKMEELCDICLNPGAGATPRIQEIHHLALHIICEVMEILLFARGETG